MGELVCGLFFFFILATSEIQLLSITEEKLKIIDRHCLLNEKKFYYLKYFPVDIMTLTNKFVV